MSHADPRWCALLRVRTAPERPLDAEPNPEPASRRVVDRADFDPTYDPTRPIACECCGGTMFYTGACKIQCPNCGYKRDCSDP